MYVTKLLSGPVFSIYAIGIEGECLARDYIFSLDEKNEKQIFFLLKSISENGLPTNEEKFRSLGDSIFELKTRGGTRVLSFFGAPSLPRSLILTHGFPKPKKKILQREKERAVGWHKEYFQIPNIKERIITMEGTS